MLTRPGSTPGSGWMRDLSERLACGPADAADSRSLPRSYWLPYIALVVMIVVIAPMMSRRIASPEVPVRESSARIIGLPLFASGLSPVAVVAVGARPRGLIAIGGVAIGVIAIGGIAVGALAFGGMPTMSRRKPRRSLRNKLLGSSRTQQSEVLSRSPP
jgi:hypothetical protein